VLTKVYFIPFKHIFRYISNVYTHTYEDIYICMYKKEYGGPNLE